MSSFAWASSGAADEVGGESVAAAAASMSDEVVEGARWVAAAGAAEG